MSTIKVDTIQKANGTSQIGIDKIGGVSSAGIIAVIAEGGTNTTNLAQGLAKAWVNIDMATPATNDSFNSSGITDVATGRFTSAFTTNLGNSDYAVTASAADPTDNNTSSNRTADGTPVSASSMYVRASAYDNTANDVPAAAGVAHGDLA